MDKREFLKGSGALVTGTLLSRLAHGEQNHAAHPVQHSQEPMNRTHLAAARTNWAGNYTYSTDRLATPRTLEEVQRTVKQCKELKALGTRHSFNGIADDNANQISLMHLQGMELNAAAGTVTVGAGVKYGQLAPYLDAHGFALHNLASLPHISAAGACTTATHGSGIKNRNLSMAASALELVTASGDIVRLSRANDGERFRSAVVGLGGLGVVTAMTLDVEPTYQVTQTVYENLPLKELEHHLDEIFASGYSVSLFTDWQNKVIRQVWIKRRVGAAGFAELGQEFFGAQRATRKMHPIADHPAENCTEQMGVPGPWYERLPHFKMNFTPSSGAELQSEYFVPRNQGYAAIMAVEQLRDRITPHLFISELRTIAADDLLMSPSHEQDSMTLHFTWKPEWPTVKEILPKIEEKLAPFNARPHWAKLFTVAPARLQELYGERMTSFRAVLKEYDPEGKFRNAYLNANVYGA